MKRLMYLVLLATLLLTAQNITTVGTGVFDSLTALAVNIAFDGNALDTTSVNNVLASLIVCCTTGDHTGSSINLSGGTNAAPTGQGVTDAATLTAAGWTVTANTVTLAITTVDQGLKTFTVAGDQTTHFPVASTFTVSGSTGNDGTYTVASATYGTATAIVVVEVIPDATADGSITAL